MTKVRITQRVRVEVDRGVKGRNRKLEEKKSELTKEYVEVFGS